MTRRGQTLTVAAVIAVVLLVLTLVVRVPYSVVQPGPVIDTLGQYNGKSLVVVQGHPTFPASGKLELTTVEETDHPTLAAALRYWVSSDHSVVPRELFHPRGKSSQQVRQESAAQQQQSQNAAVDVALTALGIKPDGAQVASVGPGQPATGLLRSGDVIRALDTTEVRSPDDLVAQLGRHHPGDKITVGYERDGRPAQAAVTVGSGPQNRAILGVDIEAHFPFSVKIQIDGVGGPSAGLMYALGIYDLLTPEDLTAGRTIAGTGELHDDGTVHPIGGIGQKMLGARSKGATVFLVPAENCAEAAKNHPPGLQLVRVSAFTDALDDLRKVRSGQSVQGC